MGKNPPLGVRVDEVLDASLPSVVSKVQPSQPPSSTMTPLHLSIYYGEQPCQAIKGSGQSCTNRAYYRSLIGDQILCGVHSQRIPREELPVNPHKKAIIQDQLAQHQRSVEEQATINRDQHRPGQIINYHMRMMHPVELKPGYLNIFPNFKHGGRKDGLGMPSLSPMSMGPIEHHQPGLPPARNLEDLHQSNKAFPSEVDALGQPTPAFYQTQLAMYQDPIPHRHKEASLKKNVPLYSVWKTKEGRELHLTYIESRQVYCHYYEQFATRSPDFRHLQQLIKDGYNLQICGYDAYVPTRTMEEHYLDPSRPFGHELVLYTMLTMSPEEYPWHKHTTLTNF